MSNHSHYPSAKIEYQPDQLSYGAIFAKLIFMLAVLLVLAAVARKMLLKNKSEKEMDSNELENQGAGN